MHKTASYFVVSLALLAASCSVNAAKTGATAKTTVGVVERAEPIAIVSDQSEIRTGDCVVVEESGSTANIRRASSTMCQRESAQAVAQVPPQLQTHAAECATAKQQVVDAQTTDQVDLAIRKVKILCDE